jgi:hypothetical protein
LKLDDNLLMESKYVFVYIEGAVLCCPENDWLIKYLVWRWLCLIELNFFGGWGYY